MRQHNRLSGVAAASLLAALFVVPIGSAIADQSSGKAVSATAKEPSPEDPMSWSANVAPPADTPTSGLADLATLKSQLSAADHRAALEAMQYALTELGDGATFVWHRKAGLISGMVRPTASFVDARGSVCRHLVFKLSVANYSKQIEGDACRSKNKQWQVAG